MNNPLDQEFILLSSCYKSDVDGSVDPDSRLSPLVEKAWGRAKMRSLT